MGIRDRDYTPALPAPTGLAVDPVLKQGVAGGIRAVGCGTAGATLPDRSVSKVGAAALVGYTSGGATTDATGP